MAQTFGTPEDLDWVRQPTASGGLSITAAIPPVFAKYATVVIPDELRARRSHDEAVVSILRDGSDAPLWWFGFLGTGADPLPSPVAPRVRLYAGWEYVVIQGTPEQALGFRHEESFRSLPDLIFPTDRSWLVSTLWDDDWRCVGGPGSLVDELTASAALEAREVSPEEDATPPGHVAL